MPQPFFTSYLDFPDGQDEPDEIVIGNVHVPPPEVLHAFFYDTGRKTAEWAERDDFSKNFGWRERYGGKIHSFRIEAGEILPGVALHFYSEDSTQGCFMDRLAGVHSRIERYFASEEYV
jgi:hypothetical protein